jgi:hypothetical protein
LQLRQHLLCCKYPSHAPDKIVNGNIDKLSIEFLLKLMGRAGLPVNVTGGRKPSTRGKEKSIAAAHA